MKFNYDDKYQDLINRLTNIPFDIKPMPIVPNQEKQIELMTIMVNKQIEMINYQSKMIEKQAELINIIHKESKMSTIFATISILISLVSLAITSIPLILQIWQ